jgi:ATP/maltotriose-dependent transcriptional regulator MalT
MAEGEIRECYGERAFSIWEPQLPLVHLETTKPCARTFGVLNAGVNPGSSSGRKESVLDVLRQSKTRQNLTGASLSRIRRGLAKAWRLMLALQTNEAFGAIGEIELQLDDVSPEAARRHRASTRLLRAVGLAFRDDSLAALAIAVSHLRENAASLDNYVASTICRLGFWQLGEFDAFYSLPRHRPGSRWSKSRAVSAVFDLSIEAAVALDHLQLSTAKRLASDALTIVQTAKLAAGIATLPACLTSQVLYEEGSFDEAEMILRDRLAAINAEGSIECALRAYLVLTRIARQRAQYDLAAILLREAEALGERRGWPRLIAACVAERASLLLEAGRIEEAHLSVEDLDRYADMHRTSSEHSYAEIMRYRTLARSRVSWVEAPSGEAVAAMRQLYHRAIESRDLYSGCRLAIELAEMLSTIGESEEADALFFCAIKAGAAAGLFQVFLDGGAGLAQLLRRAYNRAGQPGSNDREVLPFVGSLLSRWDARRANGRSARPSGRISDTLSARERDILAKISRGFPNKRIARALEISPETVKSHVKRIFLKLAVGTRAEAVSRAGSLGLL